MPDCTTALSQQAGSFEVDHEIRLLETGDLLRRQLQVVWLLAGNVRFETLILAPQVLVAA